MGQQYIQSATIHRKEQQYTQDNNKIYTRQTAFNENAHRKSNTSGRIYCNYFLKLSLHKYFTKILT
jgi:hypothetical protein